MRRPTQRFAALVIFCLTLIPCTEIPAQDVDTVFVERVDVHVVNVEVFVTDADGRFVEGLTIEDFEVFEDGQPAHVTNFYTVHAEPAPATLDEPAEPEEPAAAAVPDEQRLHLLVYVDNFNIRPANRERVLDSLVEFLDERAAGDDRVMLLTYDKKIDVVQPFTNDPELLAAGLAKIRRTQTKGQVAQTRQAMASRQITIALSDPMTADSAPAILNRYVQETRADLLHTTRSLEAVVRSMSGLPGRKALLYVSDGLQQRPGQRLAEQYFGGMGLGGDESALFDAVIQQANAHQVTFYTLDARGTGGGTGGMSAANSGDVAGSGSALISNSNRAEVDTVENMNLQEPLLDMASITGGTAFLNSADVDRAMTSMAADFDSYYSLGFQPRSPGDGEYHHIEVKVKRPGMSVRHRSGFVEKKEIEQVGDRTLASLIVGLDKNPLGIGLQFEPPKKKKGKRYLLPIMVRIPVRDLTLLPGSGGNEEGRLRIFVVVQDEEGGVSPLQDIPYPVSIPSDRIAEARQSAIAFVTQLELRAGEQKIAVGVWDELSGTESFAQAMVPVGKVKTSKRSG